MAVNDPSVDISDTINRPHSPLATRATLINQSINLARTVIERVALHAMNGDQVRPLGRLCHALQLRSHCCRRVRQFAVMAIRLHSMVNCGARGAWFETQPYRTNSHIVCLKS